MLSSHNELEMISLREELLNPPGEDGRWGLSWPSLPKTSAVHRYISSSGTCAELHSAI